MANTQKHKNVRIFHNNNVTPNYYHVIDKEGTIREYSEIDWDMEVTFTRKPKPVKLFPNGSLVLDTSDNSLFQKIDGNWYFIYLNQEAEEWTDFPNVTDKVIREDKTGTYKVIHEPDSD